MLELRSLTTNHTQRRIMSIHSTDFDMAISSISDLYDFKRTTICIPNTFFQGIFNLFRIVFV